MAEARGHMDRLHDDIVRTLEKVSSRERYLNQHLQCPLTDFRIVQDQRAAIREAYRRASNGLVEKSRLLAEVLVLTDSLLKEIV